MTASFLIVFAFTITQYIVVSSPLRYGRLVTKKKVLVCIAVIYLYSAIFWCLHLMGVSPNVQKIMDSFIHNHLLVFVTITFYLLLYCAMKKKITAGKCLESQTGNRTTSKHIRVQRNFVRVNFMFLAVLIMCNIPSAVHWTVKLFTEEGQPSVKTLIANLMVDNLLYLKFLLDPFVYAWRMVKYREAFYESIRRLSIGRNSQYSPNTGRGTQEINVSSAPANGSVLTLQSFKILE